MLGVFTNSSTAIGSCSLPSQSLTTAPAGSIGSQRRILAGASTSLPGSLFLLSLTLFPALSCPQALPLSLPASRQQNVH
ncbi:hypothetical protein RRG08_026455 [Elysia crispata]|uniref:Uncharacterized protein n=1 Tax=Elysia crispata TaxID=231223 RepID=A0AAE0Y594_9GAST|nr:hypothetical protein RRG08_026455 [Elysia crispata]